MGGWESDDWQEVLEACRVRADKPPVHGRAWQEGW